MASPARARTSRGRWTLDDGIPHVLRPLVRAYLLGYVSAVTPKLLALIMQRVGALRRKPEEAHGHLNGVLAKPRPPFLDSLARVLRRPLELQRFPSFCAVLVGGATLLEIPLARLFRLLATRLTDVTRRRLSRFFSTAMAAWLSITLLQSKRVEAFEETTVVRSEVPPGVRTKTTRYAGRTVDLSLFALSRALDVVFGQLWAQRRERLTAKGRWTKLDSAVSNLTDPALFAASSALVMWSWFYHPSDLPRAYGNWITSAAAVDPRLIEALRRFHTGKMRYGQETSWKELQSMCAEYKLPLAWGDTSNTVPFPCEVMHMGCGPSCEVHALSRFYHSTKRSMAMYLPLNLVLVARQPSAKGLVNGVRNATRSSVFLGTFVALFYYGVCLARTRVGPHVAGKHPGACDKIDSGICVGVGCLLCGWSVLLEAPGRRKDMALFVMPRALATLFPRRYPLQKQYRETLVFSISAAVVFTCVQENPRRVRGVLGNVLSLVLKK